MGQDVSIEDEPRPFGTSVVQIEAGTFADKTLIILADRRIALGDGPLTDAGSKSFDIAVAADGGTVTVPLRIVAFAMAGARPAARFFLSELYSTDDLTQRDADIERVIRILVKFLPEKALGTLAAALEMDALSELLDARLGKALREQSSEADHPDHPLAITPATYAAAYRAMGYGDLRLRQIALTEEIGLALDKLARMPLLSGLLRMMRGPAHAGGVGGLHEFLERGYSAFAHMKDGRAFIQTIVTRERAEHQRLAEGGS